MHDTSTTPITITHTESSSNNHLTEETTICIMKMIKEKANRNRHLILIITLSNRDINNSTTKSMN